MSTTPEVQCSSSVPGLIDTFARMPAQSILDEHALAKSLGISIRTVPRWVARGYLPAGIKLGAKTVWMPGKILEYIAQRLDDAAQSGDRRAAAQQRQKDGLSACVGASSRPPVKASR